MHKSMRISTVGVEFLRFLLITLGVVLLIGSIAAAAIFAVFATREAGGFKVAILLNAAGIVLCGGLLSMLMFTLSAVLRLMALQIHQSQASQSTFENLQSALVLLQQKPRETPAKSVEPTTSEPHLLSSATHPAASGTERNESTSVQTIELLQQIRDLTLMNDRQRGQWAGRHWAKRKESLAKLIDRQITLGEWTAAFARMDDLETLLPEDAEVHTLRERLTSTHASRLKEDVAAARVQLRHLMSIAAWQQAEEVTKGLQQKYPHEAEVQHIVQNLQKERAAFEQEDQERLFQELHEATEHRQWVRVIQAADELLRRYPHEKRVEKLRKDLPTIRENAEAQERKEQEELFKDLLNRQRYEEAAAVAKGVIEKHPSSQAAQQLTKLLPKVEELIKQERLKKPQATG